MDAFDQRFHACAGFKIGEAAELIVSAWVDERAGIDRAVPSLCDWLTDAERFAPDWIAGVRDLLGELNSGR